MTKTNGMSAKSYIQYRVQRHLIDVARHFLKATETNYVLPSNQGELQWLCESINSDATSDFKAKFIGNDLSITRKSKPDSTYTISVDIDDKATAKLQALNDGMLSLSDVQKTK